jgi:hypothetical protein
MELTSAAESASIIRRLVGQSWLNPDKIQGDWSNDLLCTPFFDFLDIMSDLTYHYHQDGYQG